VVGLFWERMILLAVVRVASAAASLFGLPVIVLANLLCCPLKCRRKNTARRIVLYHPGLPRSIDVC
jgi:hypothetical protein